MRVAYHALKRFEAIQFGLALLGKSPWGIDASFPNQSGPSNHISLQNAST